MEKLKPSHDLERFKVVCGDPRSLEMTVSATASAVKLRLDRDDVARIVRSIDRKMFFKSMTSLGDHRQWQDVYHVPTQIGTIYLKLTNDIVTEFLILSFKEK